MISLGKKLRNMISLDYITFNDDGTAWWVMDDPTLPPSGAAGPDMLDRPCDRCDGFIDPDDDLAYCPDCINGRHTFEIEVETWEHKAWERGDRWYKHDHSLCVHRVSVVPGMVLPINAVMDIRHAGAQFLVNDDGDIFGVGVDIAEGCVFPPAAAPGKYAVHLAVHTNNK